MELISAATKVAGVCGQRREPSLVEAQKHTCERIDTQRQKHTKTKGGLYSKQFHTSLSLFSYSLWILLPQTASCRNTLARGERSHVEKRRSTCNMISKWLAPSRPVYLDEVVHCTLSAYGFKPQTVYTINNSFCLHVWVTAGVFFFRAVVLLRGPASVATIIIAQLGLAILSSVNMSEKYSNTAGGVQHEPAQNKLPREGEHTQICPCIKY